MTIANFYKRAAVAASQVLAGFNEDAFRHTLEGSRVGLALGPDGSSLGEGRATADLSVRLLARLYPSICLQVVDETHRGELERLARSINPNIEIVDAAETGLVIGLGAHEFPRSIYLGSDRWAASVSRKGQLPVGDSDNPFGAGGAACIGAANLFRHVFVPSAELDDDVLLDLSSGTRGKSSSLPWKLSTDCTLAGVGAIGNGAIWALSRCLDGAGIRLVDPERVELSNLQRYVLCGQEEVDLPKPAVAASVLDRAGEEFPMSWAEYTEKMGFEDHLVLVALDSARDRRQVQASLPEWIVNAWTQPGDLGVSVHGRFATGGACLACLYFPEGQIANEDQLVAEALGVPHRQQLIRELLAEQRPTPDDLLMEIARVLGIELSQIERFRGSTVRQLYSEGLCGGALVPLERLGTPSAELHVPLAHQSALAGLILAASAVASQKERPRKTKVIRVNLLRPVGTDLSQPMERQPGGCYCHDKFFVSAYDQKWGTPA